MNRSTCSTRRETNVEAKNLPARTSVQYKGVGKAKDRESDVNRESEKRKGIVKARGAE